MGKIGDLLVRLGLKSDDFKKGIENAKKQIQGFGTKLGQMKAGAVAAWAAVGTAVLKFTKDFISATNRMSDAWEKTMAGIKAQYHTFLAELSNTNFGFNTEGSGNKIVNAIKNEIQWWKNLIGKTQEAGAAAEDALESFDQEFELTHSIRLQRGAIQQELNELYTMMRDTTLSPGDRQAAAAKYKALLQPLADAEVAVYGNMLDKAIDAWQAGTGLNRSKNEIIDFFTNYGTNPSAMAAKYSDIANVYEKFKGDQQNIVIFDIIGKYQEAANMMSNVDRELARTSNSIKATIQRDLDSIANEVKKYGQEDLKLDLDIELEVDEIDMSDADAILNDFLATEQAKAQEIASLNQMIEDSFIQSFSGAVQAIADAAMGVEGAGFEQVMAAVLQPIARTATQLGEMLIAEGVAIKAFQDSLNSLNPYVALAAGAALIALGATLSAGIQSLAGGASGATTASAGSSTPSGGVETYEQDITIHVVGSISGSDIILAGNKTLNKWAR